MRRKDSWFLGGLLLGFLAVSFLVVCFSVSWFVVSWFLGVCSLGFKASKFQGFKNPSKFLEEICSILPNFHFMCLQDIDFISKIYKILLSGSTVFSRRVFSKKPYAIFLVSKKFPGIQAFPPTCLHLPSLAANRMESRRPGQHGQAVLNL